MTHPRGSAPYFNEILRNAIKRGKELVDGTTHMLTQAGYPPLTEPLTVQVLQKMDPQHAAEALRQELARTTKVDPLTQEPIPDKQTLKLITDYIGAMRGRQQP